MADEKEIQIRRSKNQIPVEEKYASDLPLFRLIKVLNWLLVIVFIKFRKPEMPKSNNKKYKTMIETELRKWFSKSRQMKTMSHIAYGKIKGALHSMETTTDTDEMLRFRREMGTV